MGHGHNTDYCIQLKDEIESLIKRGQLTEYVQGGKQDPEESQKAKSHAKVHESEPRGEKGDISNVKHPYIVFITSGHLGKIPLPKACLRER